jgi:hypothetical protein
MMELFPYRLNLNDKPFGNSTLLVADARPKSSCRLSLPNRWQVPAAGTALKRAGASRLREPPNRAGGIIRLAPTPWDAHSFRAKKEIADG